MSGHSKWSTIKRQKEANDNAKGKVFSKLSKAISIAVKTGGGADPDSNYKLRMAIDAAKNANMPKANIERAVSRASSEAENLEELTYEGFGPGGIGIIVDVTTDNRNRTGSEIKYIFEKGGGSFGAPGSVSHMFGIKGFILVKKKDNVEDQILSLIDLGVEDIEDSDDGIEIHTDAGELFSLKDKIERAGFEVTSTELAKKPANYVKPSNEVGSSVLKLLESLSDHDDVQNVWTNADI